MLTIPRLSVVRAKLLPLLLLALAAGCSELATGPTPGDGDVRGIDVSHWQGAVDWDAVEADGIEFAFVKATEGATYTDPRFAANWAALGRTGIIRGAYHFYRPQTDAAEQAAHFLRTVPLAAGDLPPVLDVEVTDGRSGAEIARGVRTWLDAVEQATGKRPIVYTRRSFWDPNGIGDVGAYPLWIAHYGAASPAIPSAWTRWTFWQHSDDGRVGGIAGPVDLNRFNGSEAALRAFVAAQGR